MGREVLSSEPEKSEDVKTDVVRYIPQNQSDIREREHEGRRNDAQVCDELGAQLAEEGIVDMCEQLFDGTLAFGALKEEQREEIIGMLVAQTKDTDWCNREQVTARRTQVANYILDLRAFMDIKLARLRCGRINDVRFEAEALPKYIKDYLKEVPVWSGTIRFPFAERGKYKTMEPDDPVIEVDDTFGSGTYLSMSVAMSRMLSSFVSEYDFPGIGRKDSANRKAFVDNFVQPALDRQSSGKPITARQFLRLMGGVLSKLAKAEKAGGNFDEFVDENEQRQVIMDVYNDVFHGEYQQSV